MNEIKTSIMDLKDSRDDVVNVVGCGPSVFRIDLSKLEDNDCIYVNSAGMLLPKEYGQDRLKLWLSVDCMCVKWSYFWTHVMKSRCIKLGNETFGKYAPHLAKGKFRYFKPRKGTKIKDIYDDCLCGASSVPAAIDLALKMGYKEIRLFGVDHRFIQGQTHFWQFYSPSKQPKFADGKNMNKKEQKLCFEKNIPYFKELKKTADGMRRKIYNCSKKFSALDVFEKI